VTDQEKIQNLTALISEIERTFNDRSALPGLAESLSPLLKKWNRMKPYYIAQDVDFDLIRDVVCEVCGITQNDFLTSLRRNAADARKMFVGLVFEAGGAKQEAIGRFLNGRDHSTVLLAKTRHRHLFSNDDKYRALFLKAQRMLLIRQPSST
jgi:chromosomal replication initiation ATPase DnaA